MWACISAGLCYGNRNRSPSAMVKWMDCVRGPRPTSAFLWLMEEAWVVGTSQTGLILCCNSSLARISILKTHHLAGLVNGIMARGWVVCTEEGEISNKFRHGSGFLGKEACLRVNPRRYRVPARRTPQSHFGRVSDALFLRYGKQQHHTRCPRSCLYRSVVDGLMLSLLRNKAGRLASIQTLIGGTRRGAGCTHATPRGRGRADQMMRDYQISTCRFQIALSEMVFWPCSIAH